MKILISRENVAYWQQKGALAFRFDEKGKDGIIISQGGKHTCLFSIGDKEMTRRKLMLLVRRMVTEAVAKKYQTVVIDFKDFRRLAQNLTFYAIA